MKSIGSVAKEFPGQRDRRQTGIGYSPFSSSQSVAQLSSVNLIESSGPTIARDGETGPRCQARSVRLRTDVRNSGPTIARDA